MDRDSSGNSKKHLAKNERLPRCFKETEKVIKSVKSCQSNFKTVLARSRLRGSVFKKVYSLSLNVLKHYDYIQAILSHLKIFEKESFLREEIAAILVYEIIFGKGVLVGESKPVLTIQSYQEEILKVHEEFQTSGGKSLKFRVLNLPRYARVHSLVSTVPCVIKDLQKCGFHLIEYAEDISEEKYIEVIAYLEHKCFVIDLHFKDLLVFAYNENLTNLELYKKGHIFLQDKSSCIPVYALNPEPGSAVLDACAAPGMKSVHIAACMRNKGLLISCERDNKRFETLKEMIDHGKVKISKLLCKDFSSIDPNDQAFSSVDYILIDPSCSGSGMVNRMDKVTDQMDSKTEDRLKKLAGFQIVLLKHALKFPSVRRVVYSTCSVHEQENEFVVQEVLNAFGHSFKLASVMPEWSERGLESYEFGQLCVRTSPEKHLTNGFFVAAFERLNADEGGQPSENIAGNEGYASEAALKSKKRKYKNTPEPLNESLDDSKVDTSFPPKERVPGSVGCASKKKKKKHKYNSDIDLEGVSNHKRSTDTLDEEDYSKHYDESSKSYDSEVKTAKRRKRKKNHAPEKCDDITSPSSSVNHKNSNAYSSNNNLDEEDYSKNYDDSSKSYDSEVKSAKRKKGKQNYAPQKCDDIMSPSSCVNHKNSNAIQLEDIEIIDAAENLSKKAETVEFSTKNYVDYKSVETYQIAETDVQLEEEGISSVSSHKKKHKKKKSKDKSEEVIEDPDSFVSPKLSSKKKSKRKDAV